MPPRVVALLLAGAMLAGGLACRDPEPAAAAPTVTGGDPERGLLVVRRVGCGGCHVIPGVDGAEGLVGPPLTDFAERFYIAGTLVNQPENLVLWLRDPQTVEPNTAMPDFGLTDEDARHVAAFLYSLGSQSGLGPPSLFPARWLREIPGLSEH